MKEDEYESVRNWARNRITEGIPGEEIISRAISGYGHLEASQVRKEVQSLVDESEASVAANLAIIDLIEYEALRILESGEVLEFFKEVYKTLHSGDHEICEIITLAGAAAAAITTTGIQPGFSGLKGAGKTSGTRAALHLWPEEYVVDGSLSNKALFYEERLKPGCAIFSDDTYLPEELLQTVKRAMSSFQQGAVYLTVGKGPNGGGNIAIRKQIPPRTLFLFTSIDDSGDLELADRQYKLSIHPTQEKKQARVKFLQERLMDGRESLPISPEVKICRQILRTIKTNTYRVKIPFSLHLTFSNVDNMRDIEQFYDFLQAATVLNYKNRNPSVEDGITIIEASEEDFHTACRIFTVAEDTRKYKLTKQERSLLDWLCIEAEKELDKGKTESEIIKEFGSKNQMSRSSVRRLLYGKDGNGGLCSKIPGLYMQKEQINKNQYDSRDGRISANVIYVDRSLKSNLGDYAAFVTLESGDNSSIEVTPDSSGVNPIEVSS